VQARKGFVTLETTRRKFAVIKPATRTRVDLGQEHFAGTGG
jgi:hypothetical protein